MSAAHPVPPGDDPFAAITTALHQRGWSVQTGFVDAELSRALAWQAHRHWQQGAFRRAGIGHGGDHTIRPEIRSDRVLWLDELPATPQQDAYLALLARLREAVNRRLLLGLFDFEGHYATYPVGSFYRRHLDRFQDGGLRTLTAILYLNPEWTDGDGGQLRIHLPDGGHRDIAPEAGTLVTFISAEIEHEVLPTRRERLAITGWFRRRGDTTPALGTVSLP